MSKLKKVIALAMCSLMLAGGVLPTLAVGAYTTYTYAIKGWYLESPDAYTPDRVVDSETMGLKVPIDDPRDMTVDEMGNVYIADAKNNRIVVTDQYFKQKLILDKFTNDNGVPDSLNSPNGLFVTKEKIYVADTENNRIVIFDREGNFYKIILEPKSDVFPENSIYKPVALSVDASGRMYIISSTTYFGVIAMNENSEFQGFIGAQKTSPDMLDILWRKFQTKEQRELTTQYVPTEYNNITMDDRGFIYVTTSSIDAQEQQKAIQAKSKSGDYAPVKKLNTAGNDIMKRGGFFPPSGEVKVMDFARGDNTIFGPSKIIDVALGPSGTWSIIDEKRQRVYTYDEEGKLLFAFGDVGMQLGNLQSIQSIVYQGSNMLLLDKTADNITVLKRTEYGDILINAIENHRSRMYEKSVDNWKAILQRNGNFDAAYVGIGKSLYREGKYTEAMEYYQYAYDVDNYSQAFKMYRKDWVSKYIILIPIIVVALCFVLGMFFKYAGKVNDKTAVTVGKRTFKQEILFVFHLIFHPFDGFWDLKHEKRGSVRAAFVFIILSILSFCYQSIGQSYIFMPEGGSLNVLSQAAAILLPLLLWCVANWCLTTLFDGEGSFRDIFIATSYSLIPLPLLVIPSTIITNFVTLSEAQIVTLLTSIAWIWVGLLIFFGMMVTHDYSLSKNILTSLGTIVGMAFIMFVGILFSSLLAKIIGFISSIYIEMSYRM